MLCQHLAMLRQDCAVMGLSLFQPGYGSALLLLNPQHRVELLPEVQGGVGKVSDQKLVA